MTFREKLAIYHPEKINDEFEGGCWGCPNDYGYEDSEYCPLTNSTHEQQCKECWNREIIEVEQ